MAIRMICLTHYRCCLFVLLSSLAVPALGDWYSGSEAIMGTRVSTEFYSEDAALGERLLVDVMDEMRRIDAAFSTYKASSELSRLNRDAPTGWVTVSAELFELLDKSRKVSEITDGAFDVTYASVGRYYDFRNRERPDDKTISEAVNAIDFRYVELDPSELRVRYAHPAVYVDLGGIAKGHAVDRAIVLLESNGVRHGSVSAGGDSRIIGDRRGQPWTVGVRHPRRENEMSAVLPLIDTAVSTSGDYERFFEEDGVRYHHIIDPETGDSARDTWSATILGPDATFTDALSTSVFVLGPEKGLELINRLEGVDAIVIDAEGVMRFSSELEELSR